MKMLRKRWVKIAVVLIACLIASGLFYWWVKHSILGEMGVDYMFNIKEIYMFQEDSPTNGCLNQQDQKRLFMILSHTRKYDKHKNQPYLLDGKFLYGPNICFGSGPFRFGQGDKILWDYHKGIFVYYYPGDNRKHSCKYYLEQKYAQELRVLFDKYSTHYY